MHSPPSAAASRWSRSARTTSSTVRTARRACSICSREAPADRLPLHVRPQPGRRLRRLLDGRGQHGPPRSSARPRYLRCSGVARTLCEDRAVQEAHGLERAVVLLVRQRLQRRLPRLARDSAIERVPGRRVVRAQRLPARRRPRLSHLLHIRARRRGARQQLDLPRSDAARAAGELGGFTRRVSADRAVHVVAAPRRVRGRRPRTVTRQESKAAAFQALHAGEPFVIPNPWDAGSARVLAALGFKALATTSSGFAFTLTARAENHLRGNPDLGDTVARLQAFEEAGADVLYAPGLQTAQEIRTICGAVSKPVNVLARPGLSFAELAAAGAQQTRA